MEFIVIAVVALFASILTFFSGFGLGTILMPAFALFFPIEIAIALTGIVHLLNNLFKMALVGKHANWRVVFKFGVPAIAAAFVGAWLLVDVIEDSVIYTYSLGSRVCEVTPVKLTIAVLMFAFAILEIIPSFKRLEFSENKLYFGGAISGFFGGLSGHQGALRSAFLIKCGLSKEGFIATGIILASVIDISRISVYMSRFNEIGFNENLPVLLTAVGAAFLGAVIGRRLLKKITINFVQVAVTIMIVAMSVLLGAGII